jgi:hypothetical protein
MPHGSRLLMHLAAQQPRIEATALSRMIHP